MSNQASRKKAIYKLYDVADYGIGHPEAMSFGPHRDYFEHRLVLSIISSGHAEALRLHREFVEDGLITAPRQTSRREDDGSRRSIQLQRLSVERIVAAMGQIADREMAVEFNAATCPNCPHTGPGVLPLMEDPEHLEAVMRRQPEPPAPNVREAR